MESMQVHVHVDKDEFRKLYRLAPKDVCVKSWNVCMVIGRKDSPMTRKLE